MLLRLAEALDVSVVLLVDDDGDPLTVVRLLAGTASAAWPDAGVPAGRTPHSAA